jgi:hypothetical protein
MVRQTTLAGEAESSQNSLAEPGLWLFVGQMSTRYVMRGESLI